MRPALAAVMLAACGDNAAGGLVVHVDVAHPGVAIADDFIGASYETATLLAAPRYFSAANQPLVDMFAALGIASLRVGGNTGDLDPLPATDDLAALVEFATAARVKLLYTVRLRTFDPALAATTARALLDADAPLACLSIGNEADAYVATFDDYAQDYAAYVAAIGDARARYCSPDSNDHTWVADFATRFAPAGNVAYANAHLYFGNGQTISAADARARLLSSELVDEYRRDHDAYVPAVIAAGVPLRLSETNSYFNGGCPGASDAFASALWGLDYMYWWATHDAEGINFHTGDHVSGATTTYSLFKTSDAGYHVHPLGYAVKAFDLGGHGRVLPVALTPVAAAPDVTAYAVLAADGTTSVTIVNKSHDDTARDVTIAIDARGYTRARAWRLEAPDVGVLDGVTLGGAPIDDTAAWSGTATTEDLGRIEVKSASAAIVRLSP
jgi:hypothetical protein